MNPKNEHNMFPLKAHNRPFPQQTVRLVVGKAQQLLLKIAQMKLSVPANHDSVTVSHHAQYHHYMMNH